MSNLLGRKQRSGVMTSSSTDSNKHVRRFGATALSLFAMSGILAFWRNRFVFGCFLSFLSVLGLGLVLLPRLLRPVFDAWLGMSHIIAKTFSLTTLSLAYFLVVAPTALIRRLMGRCPLPMRPDLNMASYWIEREEAAQPKERFSNRY
jgi:hypothetical protein